MCRSTSDAPKCFPVPMKGKQKVVTNKPNMHFSFSSETHRHTRQFVYQFSYDLNITIKTGNNRKLSVYQPLQERKPTASVKIKKYPKHPIPNKFDAGKNSTKCDYLEIISVLFVFPC